MPAMANLALAGTSKSSSFQFVNGKTSSSVTYTYQLVATGVGKVTIPALAVTAGGKTYQTEPITIDITAGGGQPAPGQGSAAPAAQGQTLMLISSIGKSKLYVNEPTVYTLRFMCRVRLLQLQRPQMPGFTGFWTEMPEHKEYTTVQNGLKYVVYEFPVNLTPTKPGTYTLSGASIQAVIEDQNSNDPFMGFFSSGRPVGVQAAPITVTVLPLPEAGKPRDFNGAVGRFEASASLDKTEAAVNEAVSLNLTVSGTGNIKTLPDPALPDWPDFRKYETAGTLKMEGAEMKGSKTFKTVIVPQTPGKKVIPALSFSYFDPASASYRTVTAGPLSLNVKPAAPGSAAYVPSAAQPQQAAAAPQGPVKSDIKLINRDISYLKTPAAWKPWRGYLFSKPWFIGLNVLPLLLLLLSFGYLKWQERLSSDVAFARRLRASGTARKYLKKAKTLLKPASAHDFYTTLSRALLEFVAHKLNVSPDGLTFASLSGMLAGRTVSAEAIEQVRTMLDECDLVRFAPTQVTQEMMETSFAKAGELITRLERELK